MKIPKQACTTEFKELAVKRVKDGQSVSMVCKEPGLSDQTLCNWAKAAAGDRLSGAGSRAVTPEERELSSYSTGSTVKWSAGRLVGWSLKPRRTADIVTDALTMAGFRKHPAAGLMHHSGRGSQSASHAFQDKLKTYGTTCSMSRKGNCRDNAPTESGLNRFKNERGHGLRYATHAESKAAAFEYIEVSYNRKRQHSTLGYRSPVQFLENWIREQHQEKLIA